MTIATPQTDLTVDEIALGNGEVWLRDDREGIFAGVSSGAVVHVARRIAAELDEDAEAGGRRCAKVCREGCGRRESRNGHRWSSSIHGEPHRP